MNSKNSVYHIATQSDWETYQNKGIIEPESLKSEGFIHCSTSEQLEATLSRFFSSFDFVILLEINQEALEKNLIFEDSYGHGLFPHVYRPIFLHEIISVTTINLSK
jgi:uncharacterized protein (DUF952 family)